MKAFILLIPMLLLMACATGYHESYHSDGGYYDEKLNPKHPIYKVGARCNGYTSSQRCADIALRRSAEVCEIDEHTDGFTVFNKKQFSI